MANITAQMVKELRERTGAGMMDCKAALQETNGDMEQAVDLLRKKGLAKAAKKAGRIAAEGLIGLAVDGPKGVLVEVNSETDFVARNDLFQGLVKMIANVALTVGTDMEKIKAAKVGSITIADAIADTIAKIGENMTLRRASQLSVGTGVIASYVHNSVEEGLGKIGVLVALESRCMSLRPIPRLSIPPVSTPRLSGARRTCSRTSTRRRESLPMWSKRSSNRDSRPSTRKSACSIRPTSMSRTRVFRRRSRTPKARQAVRSR
jgi:Elongation factor TS